MKISLCLLAATLVGCSGPGLDRYKELLAADKPVPPATGVRITYLGVNGYLLQSRDATVVIDPFFSKPSAAKVLLGSTLRPDSDRVAWAEKQFLPRQVDLVLVTHGHHDHLFDAPALALKTGARLVASPTSCKLVAKLPADQRPPDDRVTPILTDPSQDSQVLHFGAVTVQALRTEHDHIFGIMPFPGSTVPDHAPRKASDWVLGEPLAFIVTLGGKRIFVSSGSVHAPSAALVREVDLAIIGVALKESRRSFRAHLDVLNPRYVLPSHQDSIFDPVEKGFQFGLSANFDDVLSAYDSSGRARDHLLLLDYWRSWTLP